VQPSPAAYWKISPLGVGGNVDRMVVSLSGSWVVGVLSSSGGSIVTGAASTSIVAVRLCARRYPAAPTKMATEAKKTRSLRSIIP